MPRWLHFILGLITLIVLVSAVPRFIVRHMPESWWPGRQVSDVWVAVVAIGFMIITVWSEGSGRRVRPHQAWIGVSALLLVIGVSLVLAYCQRPITICTSFGEQKISCLGHSSQLCSEFSPSLNVSAELLPWAACISDLAQFEHYLPSARILTSSHVRLVQSRLILSTSPVQSQPAGSDAQSSNACAVPDGRSTEWCASAPIDRLSDDMLKR